MIVIKASIVITFEGAWKREHKADFWGTGFVLFFREGWLPYTACGVLVPQPGTELGPRQ